MKLCQNQAFQSNSLRSVSPCIDCIYGITQVRSQKYKWARLPQLYSSPCEHSRFVFLVKVLEAQQYRKIDHPNELNNWVSANFDGNGGFSKDSIIYSRENLYLKKQKSKHSLFLWKCSFHQTCLLRESQMRCDTGAPFPNMVKSLFLFINILRRKKME